MTDAPCTFWPGTRCQHAACLRAAPTPPKAVARRGDPGTSWEAADSVRRIRETQQQVLDLLRRHGPLTDEQLGAYANLAGMKQSPSGLRTRRRELVDMKLVEDTGQKRLTQAGRRTIVWGLP